LVEDEMSLGEVSVLAIIIGVFVTFGATLGWLSHHDHGDHATPR